MVSERLLRAFEVFTRVVGICLVIAGGLLSLSSLVFGVPLVAVGVLLALRPYLAAELVDLASTVF